MNPKNDVLRYQYRIYRTQAKGDRCKTMDGVMRHLAEFEKFTGFKSFADLTLPMITDFKDHLVNRPTNAGKSKLSSSSIVHTLTDLKAFFVWLQKEGKCRKSFANLLEYFEPSKRIKTMASSRMDRPVATPDDIRLMLGAMPEDTAIDRRNRALIAFIFLTGMRDAAVISTRLKHVDLDARQVFQDAREVDTKFSKNMRTSFFPVGDAFERIVADWVAMRRASGAAPDAPLFPAEQTAFKRGTYHPEEKAWTTTAPVRKIFKLACAAANLPYFNPHGFRKTLMLMGMKCCKTHEELKAWSQNLGHEQIQTSLVSYGKVDARRQHELLTRTLSNSAVDDEAELLEQYRHLSPAMQDAVRTLLAAQSG